MNIAQKNPPDGRPPLPDAPARVHLMGIGGTGMSSLAGLFHSKGIKVSGSDQAIYPPVSDALRKLGIPVVEGYSKGNLQQPLDLVVVGNVIRRSNPEAIELERMGIPYGSLPECLNRYFVQQDRCLVVTGTHGKTTVSSMLAWVLYDNGLDPSFMIGGIASNFGSNYRVGRGHIFVIEGDEYDTAYFDKGPKFLHYTPHVGVITSCEFDHADIYDSLPAIQRQFVRFTQRIRPEGCLVACWEDAAVKEISSESTAFLRTYGIGGDVDFSADSLRDSLEGMELTIRKGGHIQWSGTLPFMGVHNVLNALAALAACDAVGVDVPHAVRSLQNYKGVARRQQIIGEESGILIIDDFAHHPTAVKQTCAAVHSRFPRRRLVAVFEPRSNTSRSSIFQELYAPAFLSADMIVLREPIRKNQSTGSDRFSSKKLSDDLNMLGKQSAAFEDTDGILDYLRDSLRSGDVVLLMSNGSFDGLGLRLFDSLKEQTS